MCDGDIKFNYRLADPLHSFDVVTDIDEMQSLANEPVYTDKMAHFINCMNTGWDLERFDVEVRRSEIRRNIVYAASRHGHYYPWDHQPLSFADKRDMRNHTNLNIFEEKTVFWREIAS